MVDTYSHTSICLYLYSAGVTFLQLFAIATFAHDNPVFRHAAHVG